MDKKQTLLLGLLALSASVGNPVSASQALDSLDVQATVESRAKCHAYGDCDAVNEVQLNANEEAAIRADLAAINALNIISVAGLTATVAPTSGYCYGQPCPGQLEAAQNEKRAKAAKLSHVLEVLKGN